MTSFFGSTAIRQVCSLRERHHVGDEKRQLVHVAMPDLADEKFSIGRHGYARDIDVGEVDPGVESRTEYLLVLFDCASQHVPKNHAMEITIFRRADFRFGKAIVEKVLAVRSP